MRTIQRMAAIAAMAALTVALGGCGGQEEPPAAVPPPPASPPPEPGPPPPAPSDGVTTVDDIVGPACNQLPTGGEGSAQGMADDPVATAASNNPLLSLLVQTMQAANLVDTLNSAEGVTVFAPINPAFEALPPGTVEQLTTAPDVAEPTSKLAQMLTTHVVGKRMTAEDLRKAGQVDSLQGSPLTIGGAAPDALTVSSGGVTARVLCADIPTANATVFMIDTVMVPAAA